MKKWMRNKYGSDYFLARTIWFFSSSITYTKYAQEILAQMLVNENEVPQAPKKCTYCRCMFYDIMTSISNLFYVFLRDFFQFFEQIQDVSRVQVCL